MQSPLSPPGLGTQRSPIPRGRGRKHVAGVVGPGPVSPLRMPKQPLFMSPTRGPSVTTPGATGPGGEGAGLDIAALIRKVLSNGVQDDSAAAAAASASAPHAGTAADAYAYTAQYGVPPGPFASAASSAFSGGGGAAGAQPLATLAEQVLSGAAAGGHSDDPVAAARQLQAFLGQYQHQYGPETDARIGAAIAKLQDYVDGTAVGGGGGSAAGLRDALGAFGTADASASAAAAAAAAASSGGGDGAPVYHNYILEQLTGVLDWVNNLLVRNGTPKPFVYDAFGRVVEDASTAAAVEQQQEQLRAASQSLRVLIQQLQQVNTQYAAMADSDERATMGQVLGQLTTMADRLAVAATRRPLPPLEPNAAAGLDLAPYVAPEQVQELYGVDKYRDPLLRVLDGIYSAVVVDSGLREFLVGVKQLGDSLAASMSDAWSGAPPVGRLVAYIAAVAGVLFVMRTKLPKALLQPTSPGGGWLRQLGGGRGGAAADASSSLSSGSLMSSLDAQDGAPGGRGPAAGGAFASQGGSARMAQTRLAGMDRDGGLGDTRLPSEILASGDPYAARKVLYDTTAAPVAGGGGIAGGQAAAVAAAARQRGATAVASPPAPGGGNGAGNGQYSAGANIPSLPKPPPGGWNSNYSDRVDWWTAGQTAQPQQPAASPPPPPPPPPPPQPRSVAESWEAFRRSTGGLGADPAGAAASSSYAAAANPSGGVLDATAALAAATVAAAVGGSAAAGGRGGGGGGAGDPKMAEFSRATEERRIGRDRARLRATIKDRLRWVVRALGPVTSVVPGGEPLREEVDGLLAQLESLSPTDKPLNTAVDAASGYGYAAGGAGGYGGYGAVRAPAAAVDPALLGEWRLVYASNAGSAAGAPSAASQAASGGPNLLAQVLQLADSLPGFGMTHVLQRLSLEEPGAGSAGSASASYASSNASYGAAAASGARSAAAAVVTENSAVFRFGPLGSWRVTVRGRWTDNGGGMCAAAEFESFSVRPVDLWGLSVESLLPEVTVPVPEVLRSRSEWCTTYLDEDMRVGRGSGGALFLFRRGGADDAAEAVGWVGAGAAAGAGMGVGVGAGAVAADGRTPVMRPL